MTAADAMLRPPPSSLPRVRTLQSMLFCVGDTDIKLGLQSGDLRLLKLIEELGEYFNSEDGAVRSKSEHPGYTCELSAWD